MTKAELTQLLPEANRKQICYNTIYFEKESIITMDNEEKIERRKYQRYPLKEEILIDGIAKAYSLNICEAGMFLCTLHPLEMGSVINIAITSQLTVKAEVKNYQMGIGMGVEFIDLSHDQGIMLKKLIEDIELKTSKYSKL